MALGAWEERSLQGSWENVVGLENVVVQLATCEALLRGVHVVAVHVVALLPRCP